MPANILRTGRLQRGGERELRYGVVYVLNVYVHSGKTREEDVAERRKQMEGNWFYSTRKAGNRVPVILARFCGNEDLEQMHSFLAM